MKKKKGNKRIMLRTSSDPLVFHWYVNGSWVRASGFSKKSEIIKGLQEDLKAILTEDEVN